MYLFITGSTTECSVFINATCASVRDKVKSQSHMLCRIASAF